VAGFHGPSQRSALADEMLVPNHFVEGSGAHPGGKWLTTRRRHERGLLLAGVTGGGVVGSAGCHDWMLQAGRFVVASIDQLGARRSCWRLSRYVRFGAHADPVHPSVFA
jgi:hypothetical protein